MAYIGQAPITGIFKKQSLTTDGSTTSFDLDFTVASTTSIIVSVGGVIQEPETDFAIRTNQIIFTSAPELFPNVTTICLLFFISLKSLLPKSSSILIATAELL